MVPSLKVFFCHLLVTDSVILVFCGSSSICLSTLHEHSRDFKIVLITLKLRYNSFSFSIFEIGEKFQKKICKQNLIAWIMNVFFWLQTKGRVHDDEAIEKMLNDLSLIKRFE